MFKSIVSFALLLLSASSAAATWTQYASEYNNAYFDADSIMLGERTRMVSVKQVHFEVITLPSSGKQFRVVRYLVEINCETHKQRYLATGYSMTDQAADGFVMSNFDPDGLWGPTVGKDDTALERAVCARKSSRS